MKERPILFTDAMVRAIREGRKTQTRRIIKPQPDTEIGGEPYWNVGGYRAWPYRATQDVLRKGGNVVACPYGKPGDKLWVRETWRPSVIHCCSGRSCDCGDVSVEYPADNSKTYFTDNQVDAEWCIPKAAKRGNVPSIFMPRWASRITLEVTGVRVERVQSITEADAIAEGCAPTYSEPTISCIVDNGQSFSVHPGGPHGAVKIGDEWLGGKVVVAQRIEPKMIQMARGNYHHLWNSINGPESWAANPFCWVVNFALIGGGK